MSRPPATFDVLRRHFVAVATRDYDDPTCAALPGVVDEVATLRAWLCAQDLGGRRFGEPHPQLANNPTKQQIRQALEEPDPPWNASDAAVVFVTGHGVGADGTHWLALKSTDTAKPKTTALRTADLVGWLAETDVEHLMVVFDLCYAGRAATDATAFDRDFPPTWLVLASTTKNQQATTGALTSAIRAFLDELGSPTGERFNHGPYLRVEQFLEAVQARLPADQRLALLQPGLPSLTESPCLPNPRYRPDQQAPVQPRRRDLALRPADLASHWGPRSRGVAAHDDPGWLFTGRADLMRKLIEFTTAPPHTLLVTGSAGCGKSAALARLVTLADPDFAAAYPVEVAAIGEDLRPTLEAVDVAVLATGKLPHEVLAQICDALHVAVPITGSSVPSLADLRAAWWAWLATRTEPVTIVVDALDEAPHPRSLLDEVLTQLDPPDATERRVRLLVGVRSPGDDDTAPSGGVLADTAEHQLHAVRLRVDKPPWWRRQDVVDYVGETLRSTDGSPYQHAQSATIDTVAQIIAGKAGTSYLFARLASTSLTRRRHMVAPDDTGWLDSLDDGVVGLFRADLHTTMRTPADRERAVHLLRAVAFAYGRGLPWYGIWPLVANAVADHPERLYGDGDIAWLLDSRLGGYLVTDTEDDLTVYRLFHDTLRGTLRDRWRDLLDAPTP